MSKSEIGHEMMVYTTKGVIPESELHTVNEAAEKRTAPPDTKPAKLDKTCPLKANKYDPRCDISCALYTGTGCGIIEHRMGAGTVCPLPGISRCDGNCALHTGGSCALIM